MTTPAPEFWRWEERRWHDEATDWRAADVLSAGVDVGSVSSQAVVLADGELYAWSSMRTGSSSPNSARDAMARALRELSPRAERVLIDGNELPPGARISRAVVGGDARSLSIAGASVIAKVHRDALMTAADERWPAYGFAGHKGYGSAAHVAALLERGPCPLHRRSFCGRWLGKPDNDRGDRGPR